MTSSNLGRRKKFFRNGNVRKGLIGRPSVDMFQRLQLLSLSCVYVVNTMERNSLEFVLEHVQIAHRARGCVGGGIAANGGARFALIDLKRESDFSSECF